MNQDFEFIRITRKNFIELINSLNTEQLNTIPPKFNNNIAWNFGHIVVATQGLCYRLSGLPLQIDGLLIDRYKKGSRPEAFISQDEINLFKHLALHDIDQLETNYNNGIFTSQTFASYTTSFNKTLNNIEDSIALVQSHDALHYGYALAQKKFVI